MRTSINRCFILSLILIFFICLSLMSDESTTAEKLTQAKSLFEQDKYSESKELLTSILDASDNPEPGDTFLLLLKCNYFLKDHTSLENLYSSHHNNFLNTPYDPAGRMVRANSILDNQKDYDSAYKEYEIIYKNFPEGPYTGSGSLYKLGLINLEHYKNYDEAIKKFNELIIKYPQAPLLKSAYLGIIQASSNVDDTDTMLLYYNKINEQFSDSKNICSKANLALADYYHNRVDDRANALKYYLKVVSDYPDSASYPLAVLRAADMVPGHSINRSIELYKTILEKYPNHKSHAPWAQTELATCYYLNNDVEKAKEEFQKVATMTTNKKYTDKANLFLNAINNPESIDGYKVNCECGMRKLNLIKAYDEAFWDYSIIKRKYNEKWFQDFLKNPDISDKDKAGQEYDYCFALFQLDFVPEALKKAQDIIQKYPNATQAVKECKFMIAFIHRRQEKYQEAINEFQELLENYPDIKYAARVLSEIALCFRRSNDILSSAQIYNYMSYRFKNTTFGEEAKGALDIILMGHNDIKNKLAELNSKPEYTTISKLEPYSFIKQLMASVNNKQKETTAVAQPAGQ